MAFMDRLNDFYEKVTFTANGNSDVVDMGGSVNLGSAMLGKLQLLVHLASVGGTSPTLAFDLVGADDAAFSVNKITIASRAATAAANGKFVVGIPTHTPKRYYRLESTIGGTDTPTMVITAGLVQDVMIP